MTSSTYSLIEIRVSHLYNVCSMKLHPFTFIRDGKKQGLWNEERNNSETDEILHTHEYKTLKI